MQKLLSNLLPGKAKFSQADFEVKSLATIPNLITTLRLLILPFILILLNRGENIWAFILILFCGITDVLDGFIARVLNQITSLGKILDPVIDKIFSLAIMVFLVFERNFPLTAFIIIIIIQLFILIGSYGLISKYKIVPSSNLFGKLSVFFISIAIYLYVLNLNITANDLLMRFSLQEIIVFLGTVLLIIAMITYTINAKKAISESKIKYADKNKNNKTIE
ncbi:MAG: CDP-alcohol phosphatidyltransferase family protein [Candidatus Cloacimonadia bacterium]